MKKIIILTILGFFLLPSINAQDEKTPAMKVSSFSFSFGFSGAATANTTEDYNNLKGTVNSPELFIDASNYQSSKYNYGFGGNVSPKIYLGLNPYSKKKGEYRKDRELRFSIGSNAGIRRNFNYYRYDNSVIDTFTSANSGEVVYADSSIYNRYIYSENFYDINFGVSFLFKTPVERRFHFSAGVGIEYGIAIRTFVKVENYIDKSVYYYNENNKPVFEEPDYSYDNYGYNYPNNYEGVYTTENTNMKGSMHLFRTFLPLGINFRITNKTQSFFNKVYLFGEMSPGVEIQNVSNDKTYVNPYFGFAMFGFSYRW